MPTPAEFLWLSTAWWLAILAAILFYGLLTGRIVLRGILTDPQGDTMGPDRVQLLAVTLTGAMSYFLYALGQVGAPRLPDVPAAYVAVVGGSQALFLLPKIAKWFWSRSS